MIITKKATKAIEVAARREERSRQKHSRFMSRTLSVYRNQQARFRKLAGAEDVSLPYSLEDFRAWFQSGLDQGCGYTGAKLTLKTAAADHDVPLKRGGLWSLNNLVLCLDSVNFAKGELTGYEFRSLLGWLSTYPPAVQADVRRRLAAGGKLMRMRF